MQSPFTGGEVKFIQKESKLIYRKEEFTYIAHFYRCVDTGEEFTTTELDSLNMNQVYNQYRTKYGIPFTDEIKKIRSNYGLSAAQMSEILGLGINQYRLYENGEIPSEVIGKLLKSIMNPGIFLTYIENARNQLSEDKIKKIKDKVLRCEDKIREERRKKSVFTDSTRSATNGYAELSYSRLKNIILFFIERFKGVYNTKMNKLLFYTDFYSYKLRGVGMSGLSYDAIKFGPVPHRWNLVYSLIDDVDTEIITFNRMDIDYTGIKLQSSISADLSKFTEEELQILEKVANRFDKIKVGEISNISHKEDAWKEFVNKRCHIDYNMAFTLKAL